MVKNYPFDSPSGKGSSLCKKTTPKKGGLSVNTRYYYFSPATAF